MNLNEWEIRLLEHYLKHFNAKWFRVYNNKSPVLPTRIIFYNTFKRKVKKQAYCGELTYTGMYKKLNEGEWYSIPKILQDIRREKEENAI